MVEQGPSWDYVVDAGRWVPANDSRVFPDWAPNTHGTAGAAPCATE
ncbi:cysteine desulfurase [Renibacterium salmoninarum ATCC 33209]|uniref:Cysteine desulfurase n=1 Tax=Renibacterium salmoninarum (strain ATCC 33209 / DSM 20767 / JCM 11484 / NBRC 15589 / NCIMB 2235) TaxID=288705 RepID=A9WPK1_RENSM|nr:cysteine desulfurase [Renibacterium salmoninarum ATCC 33209]